MSICTTACWCYFQVKIWFQNRRARERRNKETLMLQQQQQQQHQVGLSTSGSVLSPTSAAISARLQSSFDLADRHDNCQPLSPPAATQRSPPPSSPLNYRRMDSPAAASPPGVKADSCSPAPPPALHRHRPGLQPPCSAGQMLPAPFLAGNGAGGIRLPLSAVEYAGWPGITAASLLAQITSSSSPSAAPSPMSNQRGLVFGLPAGFAAAAAVAAAAAASNGRRLTAFGSPVHGLLPR